MPRTASAGIIVVTSPGIDSFTFKNTDPARTAIDFDVTLKTLTGPGIGDGNGGPPFPLAFIGLPKVDGGFGEIVYQGGPGIAPGGTYTHSFPGWPANTVFDVEFSFPTPPPEGFILITSEGHFPTEGATDPVPEPGGFSLLAVGVIGLFSYRRAAEKRRSRLGSGAPVFHLSPAAGVEPTSCGSTRWKITSPSAA